MSEEDHLDKFMRGLKPDIQEKVAIQQPTNLADACRIANTIDTIRHQARMTTTTTRTWNSPKTNGPIPMEIDAIRRGGLTDKERDHLRKVGGCFFCREVGHMARACPKKRKMVNAVETETNETPDSGKDYARLRMGISLS